jgi:glycosyltransferase involved in cell wall biosynthesis
MEDVNHTRPEPHPPAAEAARKLLMPRLKVLISAYACNPERGSESGKGWRVVSHMAAHHDVWAITRANNREAIEAGLARAPVPGLQFIYYDLPSWAVSWKRGAAGIQIYYYLWQVGAFLHARKLHRRIPFDIVHHYTFGKYWMPSFLWLLGLPFVWGPVGGGESAPRSFASYFGFRARLYEALRDGLRWLGELDPFVRLTARRCAVAYATTTDSRARMRRLGARTIEVAPAIALDDEDIRRLGELGDPPAGGGIRFIFIGRLLGWKGVGMAIEAFAEARIADAEFWIVGGGPEGNDLRRQADRLGVADRVQFLGEMPRMQAFAKLGQCHVLVHPSLHDSGGWVCLEAMAARRPVICLDHAGPGTLVSEEAGVKIPADNEAQVVRDLAAAMTRLAEDSDLRRRMGEAGRQSVLSHFAWPAKCAEMSRMYRTLLADAPAAIGHRVTAK